MVVPLKKQHWILFFYHAGHRLLHFDHPSSFRGAERRLVPGHDGSGRASVEGRKVRQVRDPRDRSGRRLDQNPEDPEAAAGWPITFSFGGQDGTMVVSILAS